MTRTKLYLEFNVNVVSRSSAQAWGISTRCVFFCFQPNHLWEGHVSSGSKKWGFGGPAPTNTYTILNLPQQTLKVIDNWWFQMRKMSTNSACTKRQINKYIYKIRIGVTCPAPVLCTIFIFFPCYVFFVFHALGPFSFPKSLFLSFFLTIYSPLYRSYFFSLFHSHLSLLQLCEKSL